MTPLAYMRDRAATIAIGIACALVVGGMCAALGTGPEAALLSTGFVAACWALALVLGYARRRRFYRELAGFSDKRDVAYYASSLMDEPGFLEGRLAYGALEAVGKAAADDVAAHREQAAAYRDYIELWIHEIKTPIAAADLMLSGMHDQQAARLKGELERIEASVEQALYYARSTSLSNDFAIREVPLGHVVREAVKKQARYLIERGVTPAFDIPEGTCVFADAKWLSFVVEQVVANAAQYGATTVRFATRAEGEGAGATCTVLEIADDGCGIPAADVPRVFERGFTGANGRTHGSSTGMGLYLVAVMCQKMGLHVGIASEEGTGTRVTMAFPHDRRRLDLQGDWLR